MPDGRPAHRPVRVHEADIARGRIADLALTAEHQRLVRDAGDRVRPVGPYVRCYARAVLEADDDDGRRNGWVTRADIVRWTDLIVLARAAARLLDPLHTGQHMPQCAGCDLHRAVARLRQSALTAGHRGGDGTPGT